MITTECMVTEIVEDKPAAPAMPDMGGMGGGRHDVDRLPLRQKNPASAGFFLPAELDSDGISAVLTFIVTRWALTKNAGVTCEAVASSIRMTPVKIDG